MRPFWVSAFLDVPADRHSRAGEFWAAATATTLSPPRGQHGEFSTFVPPQGDDHIRLQRVADGAAEEPRLHLDLHVADPRTAADRALALGATRVLDRAPAVGTTEATDRALSISATEAADRGYIVMRSPGGFPFCFVSHPASHAAPPNRWPDGQLSQFDQVALDIGPAAYAREAAFWAAVTGWPTVPQESLEFVLLDAPADQPLQILLHRLSTGDGPVRAHPDFATSPGGRAAEVARHVALGATPIRQHVGWTVLSDPVGLVYCVTDHPPRMVAR